MLAKGKIIPNMTFKIGNQQIQKQLLISSEFRKVTQCISEKYPPDNQSYSGGRKIFKANGKIQTVDITVNLIQKLL